jgi:hypothetical protein
LFFKFIAKLKLWQFLWHTVCHPPNLNKNFQFSDFFLSHQICQQI